MEKESECERYVSLSVLPYSSLLPYPLLTVSPCSTMRRMAIGAVVLSTASLVSILIAIPLLLTHIQTLQSDVVIETDFCKVRPFHSIR